MRKILTSESLLLKTLYFLLFIGVGSSMPFASIFYKKVLINSNGKPAIELIGILFAVMPLIGLVANMSAGIISDKLKIAKHIITIAAFGASLMALIIAQSGEEWTAGWTLQIRFIFIFIFLTIFTFCLQPIQAILDADTLRFLNKTNNREEYGKYRLWGTYGWSFITIIIGTILYYTSSLTVIFYSTSLGFFIMALVTMKGSHAKPVKKPIRIPWEHLLKDKVFFFFLIYIFISSMLSSSTFTYIGYFFDDVLKSPMQMGLIFCFWTVFEIPVMHYSNILIKKFGNRKLIIAGISLNIIKLFLFSLFTQNTPFLYKFSTALILHGPAFGLNHIGVIDFVDRRSHKDMRATYMSLLSVVKTAIAASAGGIYGSYIIKYWGGAYLMRFSAIFYIILITLFAIFIKDKKKKK